MCQAISLARCGGKKPHPRYYTGEQGLHYSASVIVRNSIQRRGVTEVGGTSTSQRIVLGVSKVC